MSDEDIGETLAFEPDEESESGKSWLDELSEEGPSEPEKPAAEDKKEQKKEKKGKKGKAQKKKTKGKRAPVADLETLAADAPIESLQPPSEAPAPPAPVPSPPGASALPPRSIPPPLKLPPELPSEAPEPPGEPAESASAAPEPPSPIPEPPALDAEPAEAAPALPSTAATLPGAIAEIPVPSAELPVPGAKPAAEAPKFPSTAATLPDALAGVPGKKPEPVSTMPKPPAAASRPAQDTQSGRRQRKRRTRAAQRFFVDRMLPMAVGVMGMLILYELILPLFPGSIIYEKMTGRKWVPYVCTVMLFWHLSYVMIRYLLRVRPEYSVLGQNIIPASALEVTDDDLQQISQRCVEVENAQGSLLTKRILLAVAHLGISRDTAELGDLLRRRADADRARAATAYLVPKFLVWGIPIFGFIGTVMGIGEAIGGLKLKGAAEEAALSEALGSVSNSLAIAFDTTLIALIMSVVALLVQTLVQRQESQLLADIEDYLTYRLQSRIRTETHDVRIEKILRQALDDMKTLQQQMSEEQGERSTVTLQTMVTANDALREAMGSMPEMIKEVGDSSAGLMEGTRDKLDEVVMNIKQSLSSGIAEVVERLEGAVEKQAEMGKQTMEVMEEDAKRLGEQLGVGFQDATGTLDESLHGMLDKLSNILSDGKEITTLQEAIRSNLDELARIQNLNDTFVEVRGSLDSLKPVLETLNKPIPLKLTFGGVEIEGANKTSDSFDL